MKYQKALSIFLCLFLALLSINQWVGHYKLSPDSTNYLTAGANLVKSGSFFVYANWPSESLYPAREPYVSYPPGYPIYLGFFFLFLQDLTVTLVVAQGLTIGLFFRSLYLLARQLGFSFYLTFLLFLVVTCWVPFQWVFSFLSTEPLFMAFSLGATTIGIRLVQNPLKGRVGWEAPVCLALASFTKFIGVFNLAFFSVWLWQRKRKSRAVFLLLASAVLPLVIWFLRNLVVAGVAAQQPLRQLKAEVVLRPLHFFYDLAGGHPFWSSLLWMLILVIVFFPFYLGKFRMTVFHLVHLQLLVGSFIFFLGVFGLSLFLEFDDLNSRLLFPCLVLGVVSLVHGYSFLENYLRGKATRALYLGMPLLLLLVTPDFKFPEWQLATIRRPVEEQVWERIKQMPETEGATHFYSNHHFIHQMYAGIPQRIIWDPSLVEHPKQVQQLVATGSKPFFIFDQESALNQHFQTHHRKMGLVQDNRLQELSFGMYYPAPSPDKGGGGLLK